MARSPEPHRLRVGIHVGQLLQSVPGGIGRVTQMLCDELPRRADVVAFSSSPRGARAALDACLDDAIEFRSLGPGAPRWHYARWNRYRNRRLDLPVDVCHAPSLAVPPTSAPLVVTVNDVAFLRHPEAFTAHGIRFHERGLEIARAEATAIIVPSAFTRDELVREGFARARIHCVPLAAARVPTQSTWSAAICDQLHERGVRGRYLLAPGTVEPRKDHATIVAAFERVRAHHPDLLLVVAGASGWLRKSAARELERPGVVVLGHVSDAELDLLYRGAEVVVSASVYEGFGLPVLEGLARGRPVVATEIGPHVEVAGGAARLFAPGDVDALTNRIEEIVDDPAACSDLRRAALERAQHFSVSATVDGHLAVYERAAFGGP
ncbi:MAG TPA: glycosyltransferase family 1 protein [Acidimicrobiia bacterium]|nr:glycosyltransferase family 1 protein [Acidimicrobiia bacterium]